jgi:hypothetical protein
MPKSRACCPTRFYQHDLGIFQCIHEAWKNHWNLHTSHQHDLGIFQCIHEAWKNHWNLHTSPKDWWFPVACRRIAKAVDLAAKRGDATTQNKSPRLDCVASLVGKERIEVNCPVHTIDQVDHCTVLYCTVLYDQLFSPFSSELQNRIQVPDEFSNEL